MRQALRERGRFYMRRALYRFKFASYQQLYSSIEDYINCYNTERLHSSLEYLTPLKMEVKLGGFIKIAA
jgi:putative transposase